MTKQIPWTSSKKEIYDAYKIILKKYEDLLENPPAPQKLARENEKKEELARKVSTWTPESLLEGISRMKISISRTLDDLSQQLANEAGKLHSTQEALKIAEEKLELTTDKKTVSESIEQWLTDHEKEKQRLITELNSKKNELESEILSTKTAWKIEQEDRQKTINIEQEQIEINRKRELEEYEYNLNKRRKVDEDIASEKRQNLERELARERQEFDNQLATLKQELEQKKSRFDELEEKAKRWPETLEQAKKETKTTTTNELKNTYDHKIAMLEQKYLSEKEIASNKIQNLELYLTKQEERIQELGEKLEQQAARVHEIANKAVEGASGATAFSAVNKIAMEQAKRPANERDHPRT